MSETALKLCPLCGAVYHRKISPEEHRYLQGDAAKEVISAIKDGRTISTPEGEATAKRIAKRLATNTEDDDHA